MRTVRRDVYLQRLVDRRENGKIKIVTGIRLCGKSFLLFNLYRQYLLGSGVDASRIITISLDDGRCAALRDRTALWAFLRQRLSGTKMKYVFLDEMQLCPGFESVLNRLGRLSNADVYVTGSNANFLSVLTEFRGRCDEVRVFPLSFAEFFSARQGDREDAWQEYVTWGGLPPILFRPTDALKSRYLTGLCRELYLKDLGERHRLRGGTVMPAVLGLLASSVGSLTNPTKLTDMFGSRGIRVSNKTVDLYVDYLLDAFFINRAERFDIRGGKYIASPYRYYFTDVGLRNALLGFRQPDGKCIMENVLYNELLVRGCSVAVGIVTHSRRDSEGKLQRKQLEVDFVCSSGSNRCYVQSAFAISDREKMEQAQNSLNRIDDSFKKIIVVGDGTGLRRNEKGIVIMNVLDFLLNRNSLDL